MEPIEAITEGEWSCLSGMYTTEEADFLAELLGNSPLPSQLDTSSRLEFPSAFWSVHESTANIKGVNEETLHSSDMDSNSYQFSQGNSSYSGASDILFPTSNEESRYLSNSHQILVDNNSSISVDFFMEDARHGTSYLIEGNDCLIQKMASGNVKEMNQLDAALQDHNSKPKRPLDLPAPEPSAKDKGHSPSENSKKRPRNNVNAQKTKRNLRSKNTQSTSSRNNDEENNVGINGPATSSCCSDDDSTASQDLSGGAPSSLSSKGNAAVNLNGKTRASRGAATDPQSLYARKRRERINERLKVLQSLVPNGTKVDISTMLEEAVQYVKFLQLQIKLLSSDDLWMYAPLAYNGMNIGLDLKVTTPMG
ncbi:hypothetical protein K2173_023870 [Erythroxylum novogranatense]|uniref:BHLH domain-containing protein n=1 Tax=Erythroxylum novogranatense TaxID=1862640 RepID=A0AAV8TRL9_9ROSI|nr:hypothetical protein K2173_023870 [Erythroxylum novogranatense]